jgi:hypothetical protein
MLEPVTTKSALWIWPQEDVAVEFVKAISTKICLQNATVHGEENETASPLSIKG